MIDAVSNINFRGETVSQDILSSPGKFSTQVSVDKPDSFERFNNQDKKSGSALKTAIATAIVALGAFAGLGYAVKNKKIEKVDLEKTEGFVKKAWAHIKNAAVYVGEKAEKCYETVAKKFKKD